MPIMPTWWALRTSVFISALVLTAGCGGGDPAQVDEDLPRYSAAQALSAIRSHTYVCTGKLKCDLGVSPGETASAGCREDRLNYEGKGIWDCGTWSLDERTGLVFRSP
jgi:hypothetical protein